MDNKYDVALSIVRGLFNYHERSNLAMNCKAKEDQSDFALMYTMGSDLYADSLRTAIESIEFTKANRHQEQQNNCD